MQIPQDENFNYLRKLHHCLTFRFNSLLHSLECSKDSYFELSAVQKWIRWHENFSDNFLNFLHHSLRLSCHIIMWNVISRKVFFLSFHHIPKRKLSIKSRFSWQPSHRLRFSAAAFLRVMRSVISSQRLISSSTLSYHKVESDTTVNDEKPPKPEYIKFRKWMNEIVTRFSPENYVEFSSFSSSQHRMTC